MQFRIFCFTFYLLRCWCSLGPIGYLHYIDKKNKTIHRVGFSDLPVSVADLSRFPCEILTTVPIWSCKLMVVGKQCDTSGIIQLPHFKLTLLPTSPTQDLQGAAAASTPNTLYICGWKFGGSVGDVSCRYITKDDMKFRRIEASFETPRTHFSMHIIRHQLCVFGGYKNNTEDLDRIRHVDCAEPNTNTEELRFANTRWLKLNCFRGAASSLKLTNLVLVCGGFHGSSGTCEHGKAVLCEWLTYGEAKSQSLEDVAAYLNERYSNLLTEEVKIVAVNENKSVAMVYSTGQQQQQVQIAIVIKPNLVTEREIDTPLKDVQLLPISNQCIQETTPMLTSIATTTTAIKSSSVSWLSVGLIITLAIAMLVILLLVGYVYKIRKSIKAHCKSDQKSVSLSPEIPLSGSGYEKRYPSLALSLPDDPKIQTRRSKSPDDPESTIDVGPDSTTVQSMTAIFKKAADFGSKPKKHRPHRETSKVETVTTSIPPGSFQMMNPRAENTDDSSPVPIEDMPIQFLKRILRNKRKSKDVDKGKIII